jgi:hypothetical protein
MPEVNYIKTLVAGIMADGDGAQPLWDPQGLFGLANDMHISPAETISSCTSGDKK